MVLSVTSEYPKTLNITIAHPSDFGAEAAGDEE